MKILLLDIETAPNVVHVWGLWNQNVAINQILASGYVMCFAAKWLGSPDIVFMRGTQNRTAHKKMIRRIHRLLDEADAVVHYNGTKFDIPTLNKEFVSLGMAPPAPYKQIDLLKTARNKFKFPSNKLDYIARALRLGEKSKHQGHSLWIRCMANDEAAWAEMEQYNINDVFLLEKIYNALKPWISDHANHALYDRQGLVCPNCGGAHYQRRGFAVTKAAKYARYQCRDCGNWFRGGKSVAPGPDGKFVNL